MNPHGNTCPHCGQSAFGLWRKLFIGSLSILPCQHCGGLVSTPWPAWLISFLPFVAAFLAGFFLTDIQAWTVLILLGTGATALIHIFWVPLVKRS